MARYDSGVRYDSGIRYDSASPVPNPTNPMSQNLISQVMSDAQLAAMLADLDAFITKYGNYICLLTPEQIRHLAKLDATDIGLLEIAETFAGQNPGSIPSDVSVAEMSTDIALAKKLAQLEAKSEQVANLVRCSLIACMSDGFAAARKIYRVEVAKGRTAANAAFLDAFGARFGRGPQQPQPPQT